mmetsp:Transcript_68154/g.200118  ORF Transcript_68154/g.200118 Transcript_68154/m.200118 type:complete len:398 (-) Transcript_68154:602-1795(-)
MPEVLVVLAALDRRVLRAPAKRLQRTALPGRRGDGVEGQVPMVRAPLTHLRIDGAEAVVLDLVLLIQVAAGADGVAGITQRERIRLVVVVSQEVHETLEGRHVVVPARPLEHAAARVVLEGEAVRVLRGGGFLLHDFVAANLPNVLEVRDVVARPPSPLCDEVRRDVLSPAVAWHRLRDPKRPRHGLLSRGEELVVHDHPLVVARAALVAKLQLRPLVAVGREAAGDQRARPGEDGLGLDEFPRGPVIVLDGGLQNRQTRVRVVPVVAAVERARLGSEGQAAGFRPRKRHVQVLELPRHAPVLVPRHVANPQVLVVGRDLDESAAVPVMAALVMSPSPLPQAGALAVDKVAVSGNGSHQVVHVGVYHGEHEGLLLRQRRLARVAVAIARGVVAVRDA